MRIPQPTGDQRSAASNALICKIIHELVFGNAQKVVAGYVVFQMLGVILASRNLDLS